MLGPSALLLLVGCAAGGPLEPPPAATPPPAPAPPEATASAPPEATGPTPPPALSCLARWYSGAPARTAAGWVLRLADGVERPWDDGLAKPFDAALASPDLQDTLSIPYSTGPIVPVTAVDHDPGRIRDDALFASVFGGSAAEVESRLVPVAFVGQSVRVSPSVAAPLGRVSARLEAALGAEPDLARFVTGTLGGTFAWRPIVNTTRRSAHSYGIAIDVVTAYSDYWEWSKSADGGVRWANRVPQAVVDAFEAEGFVWGGRWYHYDSMHFEYRPELLDPACRP